MADESVRYIDPPGAAPAQGLYSHASRVPAGDEREVTEA
jgi:hypothetical protein